MALTKGHSIACCDQNRRGGLKRIWLMEKNQRDTTATVTYAVTGTPTGAAGGEITSFVSNAASGNNWFEFEFDRGTAGFNANATRENGSTLVTVELEFYIPKITEEINGQLRQLTESCGVFAICESYADDCDDADPETYFFMLGWDKVFNEKAYLEFASGEQSTGVGLQDANGTAIKLAGIHAEYPREILIALNTTTNNNGSPTANMVDMWQTTTGVINSWFTD